MIAKIDELIKIIIDLDEDKNNINNKIQYLNESIRINEKK